MRLRCKGRGRRARKRCESGWTQLQVWLMKQGIECLFSGIRHPQTQGKVERFHGTLEMARRRRGLPVAELRQSWLDEFRYEYNYVRPHEDRKSTRLNSSHLG